MNTGLKRNFVFCLLVIFSVVSAARAQTDWQSATAASRLLTEEGRQYEAKASLDRAAAELNEIVADLESNALGDGPDAQVLRAVDDTLDMVRTRGVPEAAAALAAARRDLPDVTPHVRTADIRIASVLAELNRLIEAAQRGSAVERLRAEATLLLERQEALSRSTAAWGRGVVGGNADAAQGEQLTRGQRATAARLDRFEADLTAAATDEPDAAAAAKLRAAGAVVEADRPAGAAATAGNAIGGAQPVAAAQAQGETTAALQKVITLLDDPMPDLMAMDPATLAALESMLAQQEALLAQAQAMPIEAAAQPLSAEQQALLDQLNAMQGVPMQGEAAAGMEAALAGLGAQDQAGAMQGMGDAAAALAAAVQAGMMPGTGMGMGQGMALGPAMAPGMASGDNDAARLFSLSNQVQGQTAGRTQQGLERLPDRDREVLYQQYETQLPVEYREMLREYYDTLGR